MKKILLFAALLLMVGATSMAQSGFVSIGITNKSASNGSVTFTYGQAFAEDLAAPERSYTEGVQQSYIERDTIYDEICQDTTSGAVYTNGTIELPITVAGIQIGEDYVPGGSYYHYDTATYIHLTIHPVYYVTDTMLLHDYDLPYQLVCRNDTATIDTAGLNTLAFHTIHGCDSVISMMAYVMTCPKDTTYVAPYNVCSYDIPASDLEQPTITPYNADIVLTNNAPAEFQIEDTTEVTWTYTLGALQIDCSNNIAVVFPPCGGEADTVVDADGNVYHTVRVACHCWTKENLRPTHYTDGTEIPYAAIYNAQGFSNTAANLANYGRLYTWGSALHLPEGYTGAVPDSIQGICPEGWHIATTQEYSDLTAFSAASLKSTQFWLVPGTNETGYTAVPGGYSWANDHFYNMTGNAYYWAADEHSEANAEAYQFTYSCDYGNVIDAPKTYGYSVRCIKH